MVFLNINFNLSSSAYRTIVVPGGSANRMHYDNPIITQMIQETATMFDAEERRAHFMSMQEILAEDPPFFPIFYRVNGIVAVNGVGGVRMPADIQLIDFREIFLVVS